MSLSLIINLSFFFFIFKGEENLIRVFGIFTIIFSMMIVTYFVIKTAPLLIKKAWVGYVSDN